MPIFEKLTCARYLDAARHMHLRQLCYRPRRLVPPRLVALGLREQEGATAAAYAKSLFSEASPPWGWVPGPERDGFFKAAGRQRGWGTAAFWTDPSDGLLFLFALHSFSDLARYLRGRRWSSGDAFWHDVVGDWLSHNRRPRLPAWHPYPLSGRILAWLAAAAENLLSGEAVRSLSLQTGYLNRTVEHDIGGNHVLRNAVALTAAGVCLSDVSTRRRGLGLLEAELRRQILADGGHEERSPAYHAAILDDLDDLATLLSRAQSATPAILDDVRLRMREWLHALEAPDGSFPRLNDAWDRPAHRDQSPPRAARGVVVSDLRQSGYIVLRNNEDHFVLDVGSLAPSHLPAHAHADALSFVAWFGGDATVVDPGTGSYEGPIREVFRATSAHSTVTVDGANQCDFWGPFRAAALPRVERGPLEQRDGVWFLRASHDGYRRLPDAVVHHRLFVWLPLDGLVVVDHLSASSQHRVLTRLPLAHAPQIAEHFQTGAGITIRPIGHGPPARLVPSDTSPYLGIVRHGYALEREFAVDPGIVFGWSLLRAGSTAELCGSTLVVHRPGRREFHLNALPTTS